MKGKVGCPGNVVCNIFSALEGNLCLRLSGRTRIYNPSVNGRLLACEARRSPPTNSSKTIEAAYHAVGLNWRLPAAAFVLERIT